MTTTAKMILSCVGVFIGGTTAYYQAIDPTKVVFDVRFWVGLAFAGLAPLGAYFFGLAQRAPWEAPTLPTTIIETKRIVTDPPATGPPEVVSESITKKPGGG